MHYTEFNMTTNNLSHSFINAMIIGDYKILNALNNKYSDGFNPQFLLNKYLLFCAIERGDVHEIKHLKSQGYTSATPENTLLTACHDGDTTMATFLIEKQKLPLNTIGFQCVESLVIGILNSNSNNNSNMKESFNIISTIHNHGVNIHAKNDILFKMALKNNAQTDLLALFVNLGSDLHYVLAHGNKEQKQWAHTSSAKNSLINNQTHNQQVLKKLNTLL